MRAVKIEPDFGTFRRLARRGNLIPVYAQRLADLETPVSSFLKIEGEGPSFLLESVEGGRSEGRYSFLARGLEWAMETRGRTVWIYHGRSTTRRKLAGDPLMEIQKIMKRYRYVENPTLPRFTGGMVGYMAYDCIRFFEKMPHSKKKPSPYPDAFFVLVRSLLIFDHVERKIKIVSNAYVPHSRRINVLRESYERAGDEIRHLWGKLERGGAASPLPLTGAPGKRVRIRSNFSRRGFQQAVLKAKRYIRQGEIIQAVLSQRFDLSMRSHAFDVYRVLRSVNPSPYMFYLDLGKCCLVGSSPEVHVRLEGRKVHLRPIAGTRPRGKSDAEDERLAKDLLNDPKERAEHVMLVDLGRNDLGRVCREGSVRVTQFMTIERYSHVMHLVSHVEGELLAGKDVYDVIRATFPAGTVSGAPKIRAMEIIHELEPSRRGPYAGLVGYFSFAGNLDSCITIRTMTIKDGLTSIQAGAGIVADSDPAREWEETRSKARGLLQAIETAERGLT